ncbi:tRNA (N(6)-L-threonylcarbamoyladenosine(37)-C(2))-methylthiotransferase [Candidatus Woesearchaeota archaeon]|nr:tRNA (N(6)-L-threonylcarbamoyladenosine(37)-C(2))-methylthiotransferase [Candidatus Woesearchaeota archaeon]
MTNIYIHTSGCSHNFADSEQMAGLLKQAGFDIVDNIEDAYVVLFNTCTVKGPSEVAFFHRLESTRQKYPTKIIVVAGCIPQADPHKLKGYPVVGTNQIHKIVEVVEEALHDNRIQLLESGELPPLNLPRVRKSPCTYIIPISRGCLGACSFCKAKFARGNLVSYPIEDIRKEVEIALKEGAKEIWLTSQDTSCYGFDLDTNLAKLLNEVTSVFGNFRIRVGMMNPNHVTKFKSELLDAFKNPKVYQFMHLPVQSGSNEVLKKMCRSYTAEEFINLVYEARLAIPDMTIATDIIAGFPGETEEQYWETQNLLRKVMPDVVNLSRFWPRPGTLAAKMGPLPGEIVKHRSKVLTGIYHSIARMQNERWLGWEGEILVNEKGKELGQWIGRNDSYKPVIVEGDYSLGQRLRVKVNRVTSFDLRGKTVNEVI